MRTCPFMTQPRKTAINGGGKGECVEVMRVFCPQDNECQLWENGDCGLKVARGVPSDAHKAMWGALRVCYEALGRTAAIRRMDKIEAEMGG